jgi:hypothetical protein
MTAAQTRKHLVRYDKDLKAHLKKHGEHGDKMSYEVMAVVVWDTDGGKQMCFYDLESFESEVYGPE